jgi:hypothetical protein
MDEGNMRRSTRTRGGLMTSESDSGLAIEKIRRAPAAKGLTVSK